MLLQLIDQSGLASRELDKSRREVCHRDDSCLIKFSISKNGFAFTTVIAHVGGLNGIAAIPTGGREKSF
jgi:hypothetical protein